MENIEFLQTEGKKEGGLSSNQVGAIKAANEGYFKLLNKVLPDVKATEISSEDEPVYIILKQPS